MAKTSRKATAPGGRLPAGESPGASYMRDDGEEMVEVKPGQFVARKIAVRLGLALYERAPTPLRGAGQSARGRRPAARRAVADRSKEPVPA